MPKGNTVKLFAHRQFMRFWFARLSGVTANQMLMVAVAWQMYDITTSAWDLGLVGLFQFVPALLLTLPTGHVVDKFPRGRIFASCMLIQCGVAIVLIAATHYKFASRELILAVSVLLGIARAFQMPAQQALTPQLVPTDMLQPAVALSSSGMQAAIICGPAIGGVLYTTGPITVYATCAVLLLVSGVLALGVRYKHQTTTLPVSWETVVAGFEFVWHHKVLLGATSLDLFAVLLGGATALLPIYARDILHTGPIGLGILRASPAVGALITSLVLMKWPIRRHVGHRLFAAVALFGIVTIIFGLSTNFGLSLIALAISGAADSVSVVTRMTLVQLETPNEMRGRVSAVNSIFILISNNLQPSSPGELVRT
jgi:MFS family permease